MKNTRFIPVFLLLNLVAWMLAASVFMGDYVQADSPPPSANPYTVEFLAEGAATLPDAAKQAVIDAVQRWAGTPPQNNTFYLIGLERGSNWAIATLTYADLSGEVSAAASLDDIPDTHISPQNLIALLLVETPAGWQAALDTHPTIHDLLPYIPVSELSREARSAIFPLNTNALRRDVGQRQQYDGYKLPWPSGYAWARTRTGLGWHGGTWSGRFPENNSLDFDIVTLANSDILAAAPGIVTHICQVAGQQQAGVVIKTSGTEESLGYLHLQSASIPGGVFIGASIRQGDILGRMVEGTVNEACGYSIGTHVHIFFPTRPFTMDGYTFSDTDTQGGISLFSAQPPAGTLPAAPESRNLVRNGTFSNGFNHWTTQLDSTHSIQSDSDGNYVAWRGVGGPAGVLAQMLNYSMPANAVLEMSLDLGNASPVQKKLRVHLHRHDGRAIWEDMLVCDFYIPANTPMQTYTLRRRITNNWENMRVWIESSPADDLPTVLTDNVRVMRHDSLNVTGTECHPPTDAITWEFGSAGAPWGWMANDDLAMPQQQAPGIIYSITGDDAALSSPELLNVSAERYRYLMVEANFSESTCAGVSFKRAGQRSFPTSQAIEFETVPGLTQPYFVYLGQNSAWSGQITGIRLDPTCGGGVGGTLTLKQIMFTNADPDLRLLSPSGVVTESYGNPVYTWPHLPDALEYEIYVAPADNLYDTRLYETISVPLFCDSSTCTVDATTISSRYWLANGSYTVFLRARYINGLGDWSTGFSFTLATNPPGAAIPGAVTETSIASRPAFTWTLPENADNAAWFNLYAAPEDNLAVPVMDAWFNRQMVCDDAPTPQCRVSAAADFPNGSYQLYMRSWNPGGFSAWVGPLRFTRSYPAPDAVSNLTVSNTASRRPVFSWSAPENAAWYQLWLGTVEGEAVLSQWYYTGDLGCADTGTCTLQPEVLLDNGSYIWYVQAWGPGGLSSGGIQGWTQGNPFPVP